MPDVVISGHSHSFALTGGRIPWKGEREMRTIAEGPVSFLTVVEHWTGNREPGYWDYVGRESRGRIIAISWLGNQHNLLQLLAQKPFADFFLDDTRPEDIYPGAVLVPRTVVAEQLRSRLAQLGRVVQRLAAFKPKAIIVVSTPSVKNDDDFMLGHVRKAGPFIAAAARLGLKPEDMILTPAPIRQKHWRLLMDITRQAAEQAGARFLPAPVSSLEADGTLKRAYWANDATHANADYGALVRDQIAAYVQELRLQ